MDRPYIQIPAPEPPPEWIEHKRRQEEERAKKDRKNEASGSHVVIIQL